MRPGVRVWIQWWSKDPQTCTSQETAHKGHKEPIGIIIRLDVLGIRVPQVPVAWQAVSGNGEDGYTEAPSDGGAETSVS